MGWAWQAEPKNVNMVLNAVWLLPEPLDVRSRGNRESGLSQGADLGHSPPEVGRPLAMLAWGRSQPFASCCLR